MTIHCGEFQKGTKPFAQIRTLVNNNAIYETHAQRGEAFGGYFTSNFRTNIPQKCTTTTH